MVALGMSGVGFVGIVLASMFPDASAIVYLLTMTIEWLIAIVLSIGFVMEQAALGKAREARSDYYFKKRTFKKRDRKTKPITEQELKALQEKFIL